MKKNILTFEEYLLEREGLGDYAHTNDAMWGAYLDDSEFFDMTADYQTKYTIKKKKIFVKYNHTEKHCLKIRLKDRSKGKAKSISNFNTILGETIKEVLLVNGKMLNVAERFPLETKHLFVYPNWSFKMIIIMKDVAIHGYDFYVVSFLPIKTSTSEVLPYNIIEFDDI
jgi:hypothetical protein